MKKSYDIIFIHPTRMIGKKKIYPRSLFVFFPMGVLAIADLCEREGLSAKIINYPLEQILNHKFDLANCLKNIDFKICGIDLHWTVHSYGAMEIAKMVKSINPNAKVILGGYTATYFHDEIIKNHKAVDGVIRGDGEKPFLEYSKNIIRNRTIESVPNLSYRNSSQQVKINPITYVAEDLEDLHFSNISLIHHGKEYVDQSQKFMKIPFNLAMGRGCYFNCPFCGGGRTAQYILNRRQKVLLRTPEKVLEDIKEVVETYKTDAVFFGHGTYPASFKYWETIFNLIRKEKYDIGGDLEIWRLPFPKEMWSLFSKTFTRGNSSISICPRTFSMRSQQKIQKICDPTFSFPKNQTQDLIKNALLYNQVLRIWLTIGFPFQDWRAIMSDYLYTLKLAIKYGSSKSYPITVLNDLVTVSPASPAFQNPQLFDLELIIHSFRQLVEMVKRTKFFLGSWNTICNYRTKHFSPLAIRIWNNAFNLTELPLFISSPH